MTIKNIINEKHSNFTSNVSNYVSVNNIKKRKLHRNPKKNFTVHCKGNKGIQLKRLLRIRGEKTYVHCASRWKKNYKKEHCSCTTWQNWKSQTTRFRTPERVSKARPPTRVVARHWSNSKRTFEKWRNVRHLSLPLGPA